MRAPPGEPGRYRRADGGFSQTALMSEGKPGEGSMAGDGQDRRTGRGMTGDCRTNL